MQPRCSIDFVVTNAGKTDIKSLRVGELQDQLREQLRLQTKREFSSGALPVSHSAARVGRRRVIYPAVKDCRSDTKKFCVYSEARV
jgi:hypothetical protein